MNDHSNSTHLAKPSVPSLRRPVSSNLVTAPSSFQPAKHSYKTNAGNSDVNASEKAYNTNMEMDLINEEDAVSSSPTSTIVPTSPISSRSNSLSRASAGSSLDQAATASSSQINLSSPLHPRIAVILGVDRKWHLPLLVCRALSVAPAAWWGLRCAFTFLAELLRIRPLWREGWAAAAIVGNSMVDWDVERRFRVTEVALAIMWCCASAYLTYFFMDCLMSRWLLNYSPPAVVIRLLATNGLIAYVTSWVLYLAGASSDPRLLLPAWICISATLTFLYHATQNRALIKRETTASISVLSIASFISLNLILLQLHLTRDNEPEVPAFVISQRVWDWIAGVTKQSDSATHLGSGVD